MSQDVFTLADVERAVAVLEANSVRATQYTIFLPKAAVLRLMAWFLLDAWERNTAHKWAARERELRESQ